MPVRKKYFRKFIELELKTETIGMKCIMTSCISVLCMMILFLLITLESYEDALGTFILFDGV